MSPNKRPSFSFAFFIYEVGLSLMGFVKDLVGEWLDQLKLTTILRAQEISEIYIIFPKQRCYWPIKELQYFIYRCALGAR